VLIEPRSVRELTHAGTTRMLSRDDWLIIGGSNDRAQGRWCCVVHDMIASCERVQMIH